MSECFKTFREEIDAIGTLENMHGIATNMGAVLACGFGRFPITPDLTREEFNKRLRDLVKPGHDYVYDSIAAFVVMKWLVFNGAARLEPGVELRLEWEQQFDRIQNATGVLQTNKHANELKSAAIVWDSDGFSDHRLTLEEFDRIANLLPKEPLI